LSKIITLAIPKGGVGKTTTAVNLAACLAVFEKRTLLIDLDPAGACSVSLNFTRENTRGGALELLSFLKSLNQVIHKTELENLDFVPSNVATFEDEEKIQRISKNILLLRNILGQQVITYDYIIIDCPPYLQGITNLGLAASDSVLIPVRSANFSIKALQKIIKHIAWIKKNYNSKLRIEGVLHTMVEKRTKAAVITDRQLYSLLGKYVFRTSIPKSTIISEASFYGKPLLLFDPGAKATKTYIALANEILVRNKICPVISLAREIQLSA
jgi:chromosome partitioning protein